MDCKFVESIGLSDLLYADFCFNLCSSMPKDSLNLILQLHPYQCCLYDLSCNYFLLHDDHLAFRCLRFRYMNLPQTITSLFTPLSSKFPILTLLFNLAALSSFSIVLQLKDFLQQILIFPIHQQLSPQPSHSSLRMSSLTSLLLQRVKLSMTPHNL